MVQPLTDTRLHWIMEHAANRYSQFGEDGIIAATLARTNTGPHERQPADMWAFECGAADGVLFSNTRSLIDAGWNAVLVESDAARHERLTARYADNPRVITCHGRIGVDPGTTIDDVLDEAGAPRHVDLLSLDIDGQEWYAFNAILRHTIGIAIVEYDPFIADQEWIPDLYGTGQAGYLAINWVASKWGMRAVAYTQTNAIYVAEKLLPLLWEGNSE